MPPEKQTQTDLPAQAVDSQRTRRQQSGARGVGKGADARGDSDKLKENQRRLGVGAEHKTEAMKKGHRGTFP
jgi:hypothetical protein